jgi:predicted nucleic-acid-binding protein
MLGIDTNVVVRLGASDDAEQTRRARKLVEQALTRDDPVLVALLVLLESEWVLRSRYGFNRESLLGIFRAMLESRELSFEDEPALEDALFRWKDSACEFSDCLIVAHNRQVGCRDSDLRRQGNSASRYRTGLVGTVCLSWRHPGHGVCPATRHGAQRELARPDGDGSAASATPTSPWRLQSQTISRSVSALYDRACKPEMSKMRCNRA